MKRNILSLTLIFLMSVVAAAENSNTPQQEAAVEVKTASTFAYCCIPHVGPFTDIEDVINQLFYAMQSQNIPPGGAMIGVYYGDPQVVSPEDLRWEIGFPCSAQVSPIKPLEKRVWSFTQVAAAVHTGPYENTGDTYAKIFEWMEANGYEQAGPVLERYMSIPSADTDPETLKAEIWVPVVKK